MRVQLFESLAWFRNLARSCLMRWQLVCQFLRLFLLHLQMKTDF